MLLFTDLDAYNRSSYDTETDQRRQQRVSAWLKYQTGSEIACEQSLKYLIWHVSSTMTARMPGLNDYVVTEGGHLQYRNNSVLVIIPRSLWYTQLMTQIPMVQMGLVGMIVLTWMIYMIR